MGFYVRQSIKVGPLRFNFSKSGVGVSTGVKGLRIGTGPRGNYIHMGLGGCTTEQPSQRPRPKPCGAPTAPSTAPFQSPTRCQFHDGWANGGDSERRRATASRHDFR
ncbi:DUF4236 domain-containing protein [Ralstonia solanacearum]|uniref:DUF4236 domain-containing protein n=1 Tax=Ralstonia solanacearum TaxID=305 RepID=UPI0009B92374